MGSALDYYYNKAQVWLPMTEATDESDYRDPTELLVDGDMEAPTTAAWTESAVGAASKETTTPYAGTRCLRVARIGASATIVYQPVANLGGRYRVTGWARGDGSTAPGVYTPGGPFFWFGVVSTAWQYFDFEAVTTASSPHFGLYGGAIGGGYCEYDNVSITALPRRTLDVSGNGNHAYLGLDGTTAANFPVKLPYRGYRFDNANDYLTIPNLQLADTSGISVTMVFRNASVEPVTGYLWDWTIGTARYLGTIRPDNTLMVGINGAASPAERIFTTSTVINQTRVLTGIYDRASNAPNTRAASYVDGRLEAESTTLNAVNAVGTANWYIAISNTITLVSGLDILAFILHPYVLTPAQVQELQKVITRQINHV